VVPIPASAGNLGTPIAAFPGDRVVWGNYSTNGVYLSAMSLDDENYGYMMYTARHTPAFTDWDAVTLTASDTQTGWAAFSNDPYVGILWTKENRRNYAFSLDTGKFLWESDSQIFADGWGGATSNSSPEKIIVYGKLIEASVGGVVYCYDALTGNLDWTYEALDPYIGESYVVQNWWITPCFASSSFSTGKGMVYFGHQEHSAQEPKPRGAPFFALDVETGEVVWKIDGAFRQLSWGNGRALIGDSIIATIDSYDSQIYAIGRGPSEVTVSVSNPVITAGTPVMISGTVMDISPGIDLKDTLQRRFPKGVPVVADESMSEWMLYVWKNFDMPLVEGVEITIFGVGANNESFDIGTAVSDANGRFSCVWTPRDSENVDVYAVFSGSGAYYGSGAKAEISVLEAPAPPVVEPTPPYGLYIALAAIAIIITVVIFGLLILLRKK
jgi:hypothetical protein